MKELKKQPGIHFQDGSGHVLLWAPYAKNPALALKDKQLVLPLQKGEIGYWHLTTDELHPGDRYTFILKDGKELPDPASLSQPGGVHEASEAIDISDFSWTDNGWQNLPLSSYIIYELHTGTFTPEGDFAGIEAKLDYLKDLGITAIELMPVAAFPGTRNWGYDGVCPYAVHTAYGGAQGLMKLVDACHKAGLAVVLDVVYNHVGPEGNYLGEFGPYFTDKYKTPWGSAINFDDAGCDAVRTFFIQNALMFLRDFHIDALRLDAVHAIKDFSATHLLRALKTEVDLLMQETGRQHYLLVECDLNDPRFIDPLEKNGLGMDAQWIDEFHHALRVAAGEPGTGYYSDFNGLAHLAKSYRDAYVYDGQYSQHRDKTFGRKAADNEGQQFIVFSQNHDQTGNRMLGDRTSTLVSFDMQKLLAGAVLVSPFIPLLFMGEEYSERSPFQYFVSHTDETLIAAVREGRKTEFAAFQTEGEVPDPQSEDTFNRSKLQWASLNQEMHQTMFRYYKALIALRKKHPALSNTSRDVLVQTDEDKQLLILHRKWDTNLVTCILNFSSEPQSCTTQNADAQHQIFDSAATDWGGTEGAVITETGITIQAASILIFSNHV